jgi:glutathione S-transferase
VGQIEDRSSQSSGKPYLCGDQVTAGDILVSVIANWNFWDSPFTFGPKTKAMLKAVSSRPPYQKALAAEQVEYKAAA